MIPGDPDTPEGKISYKGTHRTRYGTEQVVEKGKDSTTIGGKPPSTGQEEVLTFIKKKGIKY